MKSNNSNQIKNSKSGLVCVWRKKFSHTRPESKGCRWSTIDKAASAIEACSLIFLWWFEETRPKRSRGTGGMALVGSGPWKNQQLLHCTWKFLHFDSFFSFQIMKNHRVISISDEESNYEFWMALVVALSPPIEWIRGMKMRPRCHMFTNLLVLSCFKRDRDYSTNHSSLLFLIGPH